MREMTLQGLKYSSSMRLNLVIYYPEVLKSHMNIKA